MNRLSDTAAIPTDTAEKKIFTLKQVAEHKDRNDLWMIINGKVYDISSFVDEHPGGEEVLLDAGGTEATNAFDDVGHSEDAYGILNDLYVGEVDPSEDVIRKTHTVKTSYEDGESVGDDHGSSSMIFLIVAAAVAAAAFFYLQGQK
ncbi:uncharacterized protein YALI1_D15063g [Yarrowia lipolytica]|nr:hypothetical protein YALI1_D15063g [Yarrowia lipolytica]